MSVEQGCLSLKDFEYHLPSELIAQTPFLKRDQARLFVVYRQKRTFEHDSFSNLGKYLPPESMLVLNDTKVLSVRLLGKKIDKDRPVEIFLLRPLADGYSYETLLRPLKKLKEGDRVIFNGGRLVAEIQDIKKRIVRFNQKNILRELKSIGHVPLPPYIKRSDEPLDQEYYQTVYARRLGSVAAPTAGLHFTPSLLTQLEKEGQQVKKLTLHINQATFQLVKEEDITRHSMHSEDYVLSRKVFQDIVNAKSQGKRIVAVGTTTCRALVRSSIYFNLKEFFITSWP